MSTKTTTTTTTSYKIVFVGAGGSGSTILAKRLLGLPFEKRYVATLGVEVHLVTIEGVVFNIWDTAGQEKFGGLRVGYYIGADAAVVFHNAKNDSVATWMTQDLLSSTSLQEENILHIVSQSDILTQEEKESLSAKGFLLVSGKTNEGVPEFKEALLGVIDKKD